MPKPKMEFKETGGPPVEWLKPLEYEPLNEPHNAALSIKTSGELHQLEQWECDSTNPDNPDNVLRELSEPHDEIIPAFRLLYADQIELDPCCAVRRYSGPGADNKEIERIGALADSFWEHGQAQPILVRPPATVQAGAKYRLIAGERRWRAAQRDGLGLACYVRDVDDTQARALAFEENYRRKNFSPIDMALLFIAARDALGKPAPPDWSERVASQFGVSRATVTQHIKVYLHFAGDKEMLGKIHTAEVRMNAALAMLAPNGHTRGVGEIKPDLVIDSLSAVQGSILKTAIETPRTMPRTEAGKTNLAPADRGVPSSSGKSTGKAQSVSHKQSGIQSGIQFACECGWKTNWCAAAWQANEELNTHVTESSARPKAAKSKNR